MLDSALDYGIKEKEFWDMTIAEIHRAVASARRVKRLEAQEKAIYDYTLANLITKGVSKVLGDKSTYPEVEDAYPNLFTELIAEKQKRLEEQQINLSALRFKQFTQSFNLKFKEGK